MSSTYTTSILNFVFVICPPPSQKQNFMYGRCQFFITSTHISLTQLIIGCLTLYFVRLGTTHTCTHIFTCVYTHVVHMFTHMYTHVVHTYTHPLACTFHDRSGSGNTKAIYNIGGCTPMYPPIYPQNTHFFNFGGGRC